MHEKLCSDDRDAVAPIERSIDAAFGKAMAFFASKMVTGHRVLTREPMSARRSHGEAYRSDLTLTTTRLSASHRCIFEKWRLVDALK